MYRGRVVDRLGCDWNPRRGEDEGIVQCIYSVALGLIYIAFSTSLCIV